MSKWLVRGDSVGRRDPPRAVCDSCADNGFASSLGAWAPNASAPFRCDICRALGAAKYRESAAGEYENRCDPASIRRDIFAARPWMVALRRASPTELRSALLREKKRPLPWNKSGPEDVLGQGGEALSDGMSLLLMAAQFSGVGAQAERVAMESVGRVRLSRAPHIKYEYLLPNGARSMDKALEYFRRVAEETDNPPVRAVTNEREFSCETMRILFTPCAPSGKESVPPTIRPEWEGPDLGGAAYPVLFGEGRGARRNAVSSRARRVLRILDGV